MSGHTPGPWTVEEDPINDQGYKTLVTNGRGSSGYYGTWIAVIQHNWNEAVDGERRISWKESERNAHLIAAAPELLVACKLAVPSGICLANGNVPDSTIIPIDISLGDLRKISAAIAKAEGLS